MKHPQSRLNRHLVSNCGVDNVTSSGTDSDEQCDTAYEMDLTGSEDILSPQKRFQADESTPLWNQENQMTWKNSMMTRLMMLGSTCSRSLKILIRQKEQS